MARLLATALAIFATVALVVASSVVSSSEGYASSQVQGWFTAYAFGNANGASGNPVENRDFANHTPSRCPNDPAAYWTYGSRIAFVDPAEILQHNEWGSNMYTIAAYLDDLGDLSCSQGNYWADIYHGRHKNSYEPCDCSGSPSPGFCRNNQAGYTGNACSDAINFGVYWATYWSP